MKNRNLFWIVLLTMIVLTASLFWCLDKSQTKVAIMWHGGDLHIYPGLEKPYIVTHLIASNGNSHYKYAAFEPPLLIRDSAGQYISYEQIRNLNWLNYLGEQTDPPKPGTEITVVYHHFNKSNFVELYK